MVTDMPAPHADKISWKDDVPVWVDQWPLNSEKLTTAEQLVQEQLAVMLSLATPPGIPVFVIKKKSGK